MRWPQPLVRATRLLRRAPDPEERQAQERHDYLFLSLSLSAAAQEHARERGVVKVYTGRRRGQRVLLVVREHEVALAGRPRKHWQERQAALRAVDMLFPQPARPGKSQARAG